MQIRALVIILFFIVFCSGCALHYYDPKTETEHIIGFGRMSMKLGPAEEGVRAVVKGIELYGLGVSRGEEDFAIMAGWRRDTQLKVVNENTSVRVEWPSNDLFNVRVGSLPPFLDEISEQENQVGN